MKEPQYSFEQLLDLLQQISDNEVEDTISIARRLSADTDVRGYPQRLVRLVNQLSNDNRLWLEAVLCVRTQQAGREGAWKRFANASFWELTSSHAAAAQADINRSA